MSEPQGWVKVHRKILENPLFKNPKLFTLWMYLLLRANHSDAKTMIGNKVIELKRGQFLTGRKKLSEALDIPESTLERLLEVLESEQQIGQQKLTKYRLISITNYELYQSSEQQTDNKRTASGQQVDTDKNDKNKENDKNKDIEIPEGINIESWSEWNEYRKAKKKPISKLAATKQFNTLLKYTLEQQTEIIDKSISNDWAGLFDLKTQKIDKSIPYEPIAQAYNTIFADSLGLNHIEEITPERIRAIERIWKRKFNDEKSPTNSLNHFERYFEYAKNNEIMSGTKLGFTPTLDSVLKYESYIKSIEGGYSCQN